MNINDYNELSEYTNLEGTEIGEYCNSLLIMRDYNTDHGMSAEFNAALEAELSHQLTMFKLNTRIVERTEEPKEPRAYKELVWLDE